MSVVIRKKNLKDSQDLLPQSKPMLPTLNIKPGEGGIVDVFFMHRKEN